MSVEEIGGDTMGSPFGSRSVAPLLTPSETKTLYDRGVAPVFEMSFPSGGSSVLAVRADMAGTKAAKTVARVKATARDVFCMLFILCVVIADVQTLLK